MVAEGMKLVNLAATSLYEAELSAAMRKKDFAKTSALADAAQKFNGTRYKSFPVNVHPALLKFAKQAGSDFTAAPDK